MTIVNAVAIHPRSGEVWDELQKQLKKSIGDRQKARRLERHPAGDRDRWAADERSDHAGHRRELDQVRPDPGGGVWRSEDAGPDAGDGQDRHVGDLHRADARTLRALADPSSQNAAQPPLGGVFCICSGASAHRCGTDENPATGGQRRPVHHRTTFQARPGGMSTATCAARLVPDEHRARPEAVTARAALRRPRHPPAIGAADKLADCGHETDHPPEWSR